MVVVCARGGEDAFEDLGLAAHVELGRRLVQQHHTRTQPHRAEGPRQRDALPLATGEIRSAGVAPRQNGIETCQARGAGLG